MKRLIDWYDDAIVLFACLTYKFRLIEREPLFSMDNCLFDIKPNTDKGIDKISWISTFRLIVKKIKCYYGLYDICPLIKYMEIFDASYTLPLLVSTCSTD